MHKLEATLVHPGVLKAIKYSNSIVQCKRNKNGNTPHPLAPTQKVAWLLHIRKAILKILKDTLVTNMADIHEYLNNIVQITVNLVYIGRTVNYYHNSPRMSIFCLYFNKLDQHTLYLRRYHLLICVSSIV